ncbi:MAG TPA: hypothetical protein VM802_04865 [Chitinophaga sp.]|uniref:hypothetical protein n=1 Tax=Chitinophaga sp. TaxID=1869181 RepID=UPI002BAB9B61|nr:hypothetical protein [Chitinophaga sp.]HVI44172.1 hypothetical protein [Chitinophaga sp.]
MKVFKQLFLLSLLFVTVFAACKKDDKNDAPSASSHKVTFKVEWSANATIHYVTYVVNGTETSKTNITGTSWSTEITTPADARYVMLLSAGQSESAAATLKAQIYVDGKLVKESPATGQILTTQATHTF